MYSTLNQSGHVFKKLAKRTHYHARYDTFVDIYRNALFSGANFGGWWERRQRLKLSIDSEKSRKESQDVASGMWLATEMLTCCLEHAWLEQWQKYCILPRRFCCRSVSCACVAEVFRACNQTSTKSKHVDHCHILFTSQNFCQDQLWHSGKRVQQVFTTCAHAV